MIINHNLSAMFAQRSNKFNSISMDNSMNKLSSGLRINKAGDDASGLAVSEKMRAQIRGLQRAEKNTEDGISFIQATEGYLNETNSVLQRLRELSVQAANGIYSSEDRMQIQVEVSQLIDEINRIASHAQFNGMNMLTGRFRQGNRRECSCRKHVAPHGRQCGSARTCLHRHNDGAGTRAPAGRWTKAHAATFISISSPDKAKPFDSHG